MSKALRLPKKLTDVYGQMKQRCYNPKCKQYRNYGERGIKICDEWLKSRPSLFYQWAFDNGYMEGLTLDRINNNGDYEPSNCRWTTWDIQNYNRSTCVYETMDGETLSVGKWLERYSVFRSTVTYRLSMGWSFEKAIKTPVDPSRSHPKIICKKQLMAIE